MSNAEKRSVSTDALETLGTIHTREEHRDAIHLAVEPVTAAEDLIPGQDVGLLAPGIAGRCSKPVGIVDPFIGHPGEFSQKLVKKGEKFWLVLYPRQITSLRHVWSHPAFPEEPEQKPHEFTDEENQKIREVFNKLDVHEPWLRSYADTIGVTYQELLEHTQDWVDNGEVWCDGSKFISVDLPHEFWEHYQEVTGTKVDRGKQEHFFSWLTQHKGRNRDRG
jgi:hypothetical protein